MTLSHAERVNRDLRHQDWLIDQQVIKDMDRAAQEERMALIRLNALTCPHCHQSVDSTNWQKHFDLYHPDEDIPELSAQNDASASESYRYDGGYAYCKYCCTTHDQWDEGTDPWVWLCRNCDHTTNDKWMDLRPEPELQSIPPTTLTIHPVANLFPPMSDDEYHQLVESIRAVGQIEAIWTYQGAIIDGRHRYKACLEVGIEPMTREWNGEGSLILFVVALNKDRRHLTSSQKAVVALDIERMLAEENPRGRPKKGEEKNTEKIQYLSRNDNMNTAQAAATVGTNAHYVADAKKIQQIAPDLLPKVAEGALTIPEAKKLAGLPAEARKQALDKLSRTDVETRTVGKTSGKQKPKTNRAGSLDELKPFDFCQTPPEALNPLLPYLRRDWIIWEPACGEKLLVQALHGHRFGVAASDLLIGENFNFFTYQPPAWDCLVTNPPYSIKYEWLERCYALGKPFALLLPLETLGAQTSMSRFRDDGLELILMPGRVNFKMPNKGFDGSGAQFPTAWFTWKLNIGAQITYPRASS